jgi:hypothetical protein
MTSRPKDAIVCVLVALFACRTKPETRPAPPDDVVARPPSGSSAPTPDRSLAVPKMPEDGGSTSAPAASARDAGGWLREGEIDPKYTDRAVVLEKIRAAPQRAILVHDETIEECSSLGGSHAFFTMVEPRRGIVHYGGHGSYLMHAFEKGGVWVASYEPLPKPESVKNDAWCVPDRVIDGKAVALVAVASREEAKRLLADLARPR